VSEAKGPSRRRAPAPAAIAACLSALAQLAQLGAAAPAQAADAPSARGSDDSDYDFNWLDPDKKIYVLQNRKYTKADHALLSAMVGPGLSNSYRRTINFDPRFAYYFSENWGVEAFYTASSTSENQTFEALKQATTTLPVIREIRSQLGLLVQYVPWYAKINVFNQILYFDWYFSGGAGVVNSAFTANRAASSSPLDFRTESLTGLFLGTGQQFHLSRNFIVRLDFTGTYYRAPLFGQAGQDVSWFSNYNFGLGVGLKL
jgi:outer membrane beta-barrel protein